jgi:predicted transcriptional regulator
MEFEMSLATNRQLRAARVLLGWEQKDLAAAASVAVGTIRRMEGFEGEIRGQHGTVQRVQRALEAAGIEFILGGLRLRDQTAARPKETDDAAPEAHLP